MHNNGHYAVRGHSRSIIMVPMESSCATCVHNSNLRPILHVSETWWIIYPIFALARGCLCLTQSFLPQAVNSVLQIWSLETRNVPLSYDAKHISIYWIVKAWLSVPDELTDRQTLPYQMPHFSRLRGKKCVPQMGGGAPARGAVWWPTPVQCIKWFMSTCKDEQLYDMFIYNNSCACVRFSCFVN